jgi:CTP:molybdopterin cytidylyltransferase MocA
MRDYFAIAGIILAAGGSKRYRQPKILLPWAQNKSIIRHIGEIAVESRLSQVIVVVGASIEPVIEQFSDLPVKFVINHD